jgi:RNA polymerase sigma factor (sigma-70 family)
LRLSRNREDAEDLTQITFLNAYAALQRGAQPDAPRAWLHAIARNAGSRNYRQRRIVEVELDDETSARFDEAAPTVAELQNALANLTLNQRAALLMREVGGLSAREIATRLGISPGAVATLLFRARRALRAELGGTPERSPLLGGLATAATALRAAWLRLLGPAYEGSEVLSRSAAAVGVAAAAAGVALVTTSADPRPARADHTREARAAVQLPVTVPVAHVRRVRVTHVSVPVEVPVEVRGVAHVVPVVPSAPSHHRVVATAPRHVRVSAASPAPSEPATVESGASEHVATPAPAAPAAQAPADNAQPAAAGAPAPDPQPVAQGQALVTSTSQKLPSTTPVTSAVSSATAPVTSAVSSSTATVTSAAPSPSAVLPDPPVPAPVEVPPVTVPPPPPVEPPALPPPPPGNLPSG